MTQLCSAWGGGGGGVGQLLPLADLATYLNLWTMVEFGLEDLLISIMFGQRMWQLRL